MQGSIFKDSTQNRAQEYEFVLFYEFRPFPSHNKKWFRARLVVDESEIIERLGLPAGTNVENHIAWKAMEKDAMRKAYIEYCKDLDERRNRYIMQSKRSKACDIPKKVKEAVWKRDGEKCVLCGNVEAMPNAHFVPRSKGGLGIEQNIVTLCSGCHFDLDQTPRRRGLLRRVKSYLDLFYPDFPDEDRRYKKGY